MTPDVPPPNPFYQWRYSLPSNVGQAIVVIPAPGGVVTPEDARDLLDWLQLICRRLEKYASQPIEGATP